MDLETRSTGRTPVAGGLTTVDGIEHYRIEGLENMEPFLMSVVSDCDLWMFVSSTTALTAGRIDRDNALFPYETDDRIHRAAGITGPVTVVARVVDGSRLLWRPLGPVVGEGCTRAVSKSVLGNRIVFEETNAVWGLQFRMTWEPSRDNGWVRTSEIVDIDSAGATLEVLDGLLDVMPAGVDAGMEQVSSNLVDAYKRSETGRWGSAGVFSLESLVSDRAEPAEALASTLVWSAGWDAEIHLDERVIAAMLHGRGHPPTDLLTGRRGSYLLRGAVQVEPGDAVSWTIVADTGLGHATLRDRVRFAATPDAVVRVRGDIASGNDRLRILLAGADAFQSTGDRVADAHHLSNVLFNCMRGGVFPHVYRLPVADLLDFIGTRNRAVFASHGAEIRGLGEWVDLEVLRSLALSSGDPDLIRMVLEYLPLTFSRRHGDPSRPWNRFSIMTQAADGSELLFYEGNWRDIFQNWEALLHSYPGYFANVVAKFVNASTADGHNPYRITRNGIDWEIPEPDDPWSNIGYWGDHQIVYLLRLLEGWEAFDPGGIHPWLSRPVFTYADVPYVLAGHETMVSNPRNTISFDYERQGEIERRVDAIGTDGRLTFGADGRLVRVGLMEKLLVPALAKITAFVPHGGIWMNTQRPEWNDANNALAGYGLSMVTLFYLHRYLRYIKGLPAGEPLMMSVPMARWLSDLTAVLEGFEGSTLDGNIDDAKRREMMDALGAVGSAYRTAVPSEFSRPMVAVTSASIERFCDTALRHLRASIASARRPDGLFDSYNLVGFPDDLSASVDRLGPMLEGQVAALSSRALDPAVCADVIDALYASEMYRPDQHSFMLYPARRLPSFLDRNELPQGLLDAHPVLEPLIGSVLTRDSGGGLHFAKGLINRPALEAALDASGCDGRVRDLVSDVYEQVFRHHSFTGRSGAMYGYEGIGSVYWHMVAKLLLAVQEVYRDSVAAGASDAGARLAVLYRQVRSGLGFGKDPESYGAIPTDCYSHTPAHAGAQQPGMTGQVKEEILTRMGEIGLRVIAGRIALEPGLLPAEELMGTTPARLTVCRVPVELHAGSQSSVEVLYADGRAKHRTGAVLDEGSSASIFASDGSISKVVFTVEFSQEEADE